MRGEEKRENEGERIKTERYRIRERIRKRELGRARENEKNRE